MQKLNGFNLEEYATILILPHNTTIAFPYTAITSINKDSMVATCGKDSTI